METLPEGHFIHEAPDGMVYLRCKADQLITDDELQLSRNSLPPSTAKYDWALDFKKNIFTIHEAEQEKRFTDDLPSILRPSPETLAARRLAFNRYMPVMRFTLKDKTNRLFLPERYCFRGSVDSWISIGGRDKLSVLLSQFAPRLGQDSFYDLHRM